MDSQSRLDELKARIIQADPTPGLRADATQLVMGEGNPNAGIVFIGEAPGKKEDIEGRPFVGASGKLLNTMLEAADMDRSDVYITNIVKYRPPNNRDPLPAEKAASLPFLLEQLDIINPEVVITLGRISMEYFIPDDTITNVHGKARRVSVGGREILLVPLFHPSAGLRNGKLRQMLFDDFLKLPETIANLKESE